MDCIIFNVYFRNYYMACFYRYRGKNRRKVVIRKLVHISFRLDIVVDNLFKHAVYGGSKLTRRFGVLMGATKMLKAKTRIPYKSEIMKELKERGIENATPSEILDHFFGDYDGWVCSEYTIRKYEPVKQTLIQRFNLLWVYPLFLVIAPFRWIIFGRTGFKTESRAYQILEKLIGKI